MRSPLRLDGPPPALPPALDRLAERWAATRPRMRWALAVVAVLAVLAVTGRGAATSPWGPTTTVLVAARDLPPGRPLEAGDVVAAPWPRALVPPDAPADAAATSGQVLAVGLPAGSVLTARHLAVAGVAADLPPDRVAYPLPLAEGAVLATGQRVDLVAGDGAGGGTRLATAATVLAVDGATAWVAVSRDEAPALAGAVAWGAVVPVVLPPASAGGVDAPVEQAPPRGDGHAEPEPADDVAG